MLITLPFPPSELKPNRSNGHHWSKIKKVKDAYKLECYKASIPHNGSICGFKGRVALSIVFYPSTYRGDLDGYLSSLKSGLDVVAKVIGVDDRQFRPILLDVGKSDKGNPRVEITISTDGNLSNSTPLA